MPKTLRPQLNHLINSTSRDSGQRSGVELTAEHMKLPRIVRDKHFFGYRQYADDLKAEGLYALVIAAQEYDPTRVAHSVFGAFAYQRIRWRMAHYLRKQQKFNRYLPFSAVRFKAVGRKKNIEETTLYLRPVPASRDWFCLACQKPIDWDARDQRREHNRKNLCRNCQRARTRAKKLFHGQGVCRVCASVIRSQTIPAGGLRSHTTRIRRAVCICSEGPTR